MPVLLGAKYASLVESAAQPGESFYRDGATWLDFRDDQTIDYPGTANFCIKGLSEWWPCDCSYQCDGDEDGFITVLDMGILIDVLFRSAPEPQDPTCPMTRYDFDCDGETTSLDLTGVIDYLFAAGSPPDDPCAP